MWKRLGTVFGIQTAIFTIATGYDQFTDGGIQIFFDQIEFPINIAIIVFWTIPISITLILEAIRVSKNWFMAFLEKKYISFQLSTRKIPSLSKNDLEKLINSAHHKGLLNNNEKEQLLKIVDNVTSYDMLLLEFFDNPYSIIKKYKYNKHSIARSFSDLFYSTFPFLKHTDPLVKLSVEKLCKLGMIELDFENFNRKQPNYDQNLHFTSSLGHKLIYLVKKTPFYS